MYYFKGLVLSIILKNLGNESNNRNDIATFNICLT